MVDAAGPEPADDMPGGTTCRGGNRRLSLSELAGELQMSKQAVAKHVANGMPTDTVRHAWHWYRTNVRLTVGQGDRRTRPPPAVLVDQANELIVFAAAALHARRFDTVEADLRSALRAVPQSHRSRVLLDVDVADALCADIIAALKATEATGSDEPCQPMTDQEAERMGQFWYSVAAGEPLPVPTVS